MVDGQTLDEAQSRELAKQISSKTKAPFDNAYRGALAIAESVYIQGFLVVAGKGSKPIEHAWLEVNDQIVDPSFPALNRKAQDLFYFPAHRLTVKQLKAAIEEAKEDYPEDNPLPIYGAMPYEYYGDVMLGDRTYQTAYQTAQDKCREGRKERIKDEG